MYRTLQANSCFPYAYFVTNKVNYYQAYFFNLKTGNVLHPDSSDRLVSYDPVPLRILLLVISQAWVGYGLYLV